MSGPGTATAPPAPAEAVVRALTAARAALAARSAEVDDINVFPVADGDTGVNMLRTAAAVEEAALATTGLPRPERCAALARAALVGARGNSGMILSQIVRGAADAVAVHDGPADGELVARALRAAAVAAHDAVREPVEGTMLTVARRMADAAEAVLPAAPQDVLTAALDGAREAVLATRDQLDVLGDAGVVDSGALGLAILLEGVVAAAGGQATPVAVQAAPAAPAATAGHLPSRHRYCTTFLVEGDALDLAAIEAALAPV
ncbi:MAG: DAK2 domain-containing protein, partial [Thermoleophilia bacterium]